MTMNLTASTIDRNIIYLTHYSTVMLHLLFSSLSFIVTIVAAAAAAAEKVVIGIMRRLKPAFGNIMKNWAHIAILSCASFVVSSLHGPPLQSSPG